MLRIISRIKKSKPSSKLMTSFKPNFNKSYTSNTLIAASFASAAIFPTFHKKKTLSPEEEARNVLCEGLKRNWHCDELRDLSPEQIPEALVKGYLKYQYKQVYIQYFNKQIKILVEYHHVPMDEALELLVKYNPEQHKALEHLHPSEIEGLNAFELFVLIQTKKCGVKADEIRNSDSISCWTAAKLFITLVEDRHMSPKDALSEVQGLVIKDGMNDSIAGFILTAIGKKYYRKDVMQLLNGKSIAEVESDPKAKELFKTKINYIIERGCNKTLYHLLAPLEQFNKLEQEVLQELHWYSHLPYNNAITLLRSMTQEELLQFNTRQYRRMAHEKIKTWALSDKDIWFNTYSHVHALDVLVNKHMLPISQALEGLKSIQNIKQIESIAKGATLAQSAEMTKEQQCCFLELNDFQFSYGLSSEYRLTGSLALTIKTDIPQDKNHFFGTFAARHLKDFVAGRIPIADSIKLINLMDYSAHRGFKEYSKDVTHLLKPRYHEIDHVFLKREDVVPHWTEETRNVFHPGDIISALSREYNCLYDFSNSNNPYAVSDLAFHVVGLGRDFFNNISDEKPILDIEKMRMFNQVDQYLREQFPDIAAFADSMKKLYILDSEDKKKELLQLIEEKFGKEIIIQPGLMKKEEEVNLLTCKR